MMYNVAHFMLPPAEWTEKPALAGQGSVEHLDTTWGHRVASGLLRLVAIAATVQLASAAGVVMLSTVAWQGAGRAGALPNWMGWYGKATAGWRVALAMVAVAGVVAGLWWLSVATARKYEGRTTKAEQKLNATWPLTQPGFWKGEVLVGRQRALHTAAALAAVALIGAMSAGHVAARWVAVILAAAVLAAAVTSACAPLAERHTVTLVYGGCPKRKGPGRWCRSVLAAAAVALVTSAAVSGITDRLAGPQTGAPPGLTTFTGVLLAAQAASLVGFTITVAVLALRARPNRSTAQRRQDPPYLGGMLGALFATFGVLLGGLFSAVVSIGVTRLLGTPVPNGLSFSARPADALAVPWPVYALGIAPIGMLAGMVIAAILLGRGYRSRRRGFEAVLAEGPSEVAAAYRAQDAPQARAASDDDDTRCKKSRRAIASAWAIGLLAEDAAGALACVVISGVLVVLAAEIAAAPLAGSGGHPWRVLQGLASFVALLGVLAAGWLVSVLRSDYRSATSRRNIGALWDVFTFWPRAVHPLAPPCYGERAVPELVDRIRLLTGHTGHDPDDVTYLHAEAELPDLRRTHGLAAPPGPVLLTGYSQGSVLAAATIAQLPVAVRDQIALLTLACPARRLHGRAFPAFFGTRQLDALAGLLDTGAEPNERGRWKNLRRRSDYYGSWIFDEPEPRLSDTQLRNHVDQPCWDPVVLVPDANPTPPPIHRHACWWQDPRTAELGTHLVDLLSGADTHYATGVAN